MIITVKHNFETAHRLPFLKGKCENLHGHSWWAEFMWDFPMDENGLTCEYGELKRDVRNFIDTALDHGTMIGIDDPLFEYRKLLGKHFIFGTVHDKSAWYPLYYGYEARPWPTVEAVAEMLAHFAPEPSYLFSVEVQETFTNKAIWRADANQ